MSIWPPWPFSAWLHRAGQAKPISVPLAFFESGWQKIGVFLYEWLQIDGTPLSWLYEMAEDRFVADGSGRIRLSYRKMMALLQSAARRDGEGLMLVVCPASVLLNWAEKIDRFYKGMEYAVYYGPERDLQKAGELGLILTTYGVVRQDLDILRMYPFDIILFDGIQHLKNRNTAIHQAAAGLDGRVKIGLTGTPVENSLQDLRSLFDIYLPVFWAVSGNLSGCMFSR